jgi:hypothetical protein
MDLMDLTPKTDIIVVTIKHPSTEELLKNEDGSPMTITVYAPYTKEYKAVVHGIANKRLQAASKNKKSLDYTMEELEEAALESLAKTTKEWNITYGGEVPKLTEAKAKEVYDKVFWIKTQIEGAVETSMDFMKA